MGCPGIDEAVEGFGGHPWFPLEAHHRLPARPAHDAALAGELLVVLRRQPVAESDRPATSKAGEDGGLDAINTDQVQPPSLALGAALLILTVAMRSESRTRTGLRNEPRLRRWECWEERVRRCHRSETVGLCVVSASASVGDIAP